MRVLLADDHTLVRAGIRTLVEGLPGVSVVAETGDGREAVELCERLRPDVVLLDVTMPGLNGLEAAPRIAKAAPATRILVLSMHASEGYVAQALRAGVHGYLIKDAAATELEVALRSVMRGEPYMSPAISRHVVDGFLRGAGQPASPLTLLTARQREILQLVAEGRSTKEIAADLGLSVKTVETHRAQLMERLEIRDVAGLVRLAIREGLVSSDH
jgi:DNA-binding NarL/FixJ family response regulator